MASSEQNSLKDVSLELTGSGISASDDERIPSQSGTPTVIFTKNSQMTELDSFCVRHAEHVAESVFERNENVSPNIETSTPCKASHPVGSSYTPLKASPIKELPSEENDQSIEPDIKNAVLNLTNDVSMMSIDGNVTSDFAQLKETEADITAPVTTPEETEENSANEGGKALLEAVISAVSRAEHSSVLLGGETTFDMKSICDEDDDQFSTPTQGTPAKNGTFDKNVQQVSSKKSTPLNGTFDKTERDQSRLNVTFEKERSLAPNDESQFELKLDSTYNADEQNEIIANETESSLPSSQENESYVIESGTKKQAETSCREENSKHEPQKEGKHPTVLKRRFEVSFVSSPKRTNLQQTPRPMSKRSGRSSLINLNDSIAFDFSTAVKTAESNGGVAEMGSFVFSSSSGLPVVKAENPFDLSLLEQIDTSNNNKDEKYTRVSFIAMFDPIKAEEKSKRDAEVANKAFSIPENISRVSDVASNYSPLVKGLPTPVFARPKQVAKVIQASIETQTDFVPEPVRPQIDEKKVEDLLRESNDKMEKQRKALALYEQVTKKFMETRQTTLAVSEAPELLKLKSRLAEERSRNEQIEESVRSMERSMHSTLKRMSDFREANEDLRKVVEEQQTALANTRQELEKTASEWAEDVAKRDQEAHEKQSRWDDANKAHEKAISLLKLQLQAKDSEIESLTMQNSIARKEVESLRSLVKTMNSQ